MGWGTSELRSPLGSSVCPSQQKLSKGGNKEKLTRGRNKDGAKDPAIPATVTEPVFSSLVASKLGPRDRLHWASKQLWTQELRVFPKKPRVSSSFGSKAGPAPTVLPGKLRMGGGSTSRGGGRLKARQEGLGISSWLTSTWKELLLHTDAHRKTTESDAISPRAWA